MPGDKHGKASGEAPMPKKSGTKQTRPAAGKGKLRIGDMWNAITIIASSQSNPLKAIAEFVENSIDARAKRITIIRGREKNQPYLRIVDDGQGIPCDDEGRPDFKYVATHICDSIKRRMKAEGATGLQGEFGIGLLSFWTVGEELALTSSGRDGKTWEMRMARGEQGYTIRERRILIPREGTELSITPLLPGLRQLNGEKIQWYLASELRDRIRSTGVEIEIVDRTARKQFTVEPRQFTGRLLHRLPPAASAEGEIYLELYLCNHDPRNKVELHRSGTRVLTTITELDHFDRDPWNSGYLQGIIDIPFLKLTPGTRAGVIRDETYSAGCAALEAVETELARIVGEQREAEEQRASRRILKTIQKALREALLALPPEEYDWFDIHGRAGKGGSGRPKVLDGEDGGEGSDGSAAEPSAVSESGTAQKPFFEFAGPLHSVRAVPASCVMPVNSERQFRAAPRDASRRTVDRDLAFRWRILEGDGLIIDEQAECTTFVAPPEPGLVRLQVTTTQDQYSCSGESLVTVTDSLIPSVKGGAENRHGMPGYTYHRAPGELWRSKYDSDKNLVVINNGHRDFVFASRQKARKLRYICRLFAKELVCRNFPGIPHDQLLERMVELTLYTEENLR